MWRGGGAGAAAGRYRGLMVTMFVCRVRCRVQDSALYGIQTSGCGEPAAGLCRLLVCSLQPSPLSPLSEDQVVYFADNFDSRPC